MLHRISFADVHGTDDLEKLPSVPELL